MKGKVVIKCDIKINILNLFFIIATYGILVYGAKFMRFDAW